MQNRSFFCIIHSN